jgi:CheY-like chemotaxis protein
MKLAPDLKLLEADPLQIKQVITNLVLHGQDSLTQGGRILIETTNVVRNTTDVRNANGLKPGGYVLLSISDTGPGMDLEKQSHIFEPFFSLKDQTAIDNIGLATVYGIVKQSGADILVHSQVGRGTTFQIYFPQVQLPEQKIQETATKTKTPYGLKTIVVVDDEDMVRRLAVRILKKEAYHVLEASSPMEAISVCNRYTATIHLLLTDVIMPQMNGKQLADQIRILHPETKVLFMSGYTDKAVIAQEILKSNIDFIQKPFSPEALSRKTSEVLHTQS